MFRISHYMQELKNPTPLAPRREPPGPVVIWNLVRRCNLTCKHCYSISADRDFPGELTTEEVYRVMDDLKRFGVPVLILSGGEPLLRPDIYAVSQRAKAMGFYVGLSTNGTLIDESRIARIAEVGYDYVGISLDGLRETHDRFRRRPGAFDASLRAIRLCRDAGIKVGIRFTITQDNAHELPALLRLMEEEGIEKFYLSHLNYAGRGNVNRKDDVALKTTRLAMDLLFDTCWDYVERGIRKEFVTGNNDADGVYLSSTGRAAASPRPSSSTCVPSSPSGAATPRGSTSPISTTWAAFTLTPSGGTTRSAMCACGRSPRSGAIRPIRFCAGSSAARGPSRAAAPLVVTSTSAAATRACAPGSSPATPGPRIPPATSTTRRSGSRIPSSGSGSLPIRASPLGAGRGSRAQPPLCDRTGSVETHSEEKPP